MTNLVQQMTCQWRRGLRLRSHQMRCCVARATCRNTPH